MQVRVRQGKGEYFDKAENIEVNGTKLSDILEKVKSQEKEIEILTSQLNLMNKNITTALKSYISSNNKTESLIAQAQDLLSLKVTQLEKDVENLKDKTKFM